MTNFFLNPRVVPSTVGADSAGFMAARGDRSGNLGVVFDLDLLAREGLLFAANMGSAATPLTFLAYAANRPDAWVYMPANTTKVIIPVYCHIALAADAGTSTTIEVRTAQNNIGNGTSTAASVAPTSLHANAPVVSIATARQLATGDTTAETNPLSVFRSGFAAASGASETSVHMGREAMGFPVLYNANGVSWEVFISATTTQPTGYVVMIWAEVPSSRLI